MQSIIPLFALSVVSLVFVVLLHGQKLVWITATVGLFTGFVYFVNKFGPLLVDRLSDELPVEMGTHWVLTI